MPVTLQGEPLDVTDKAKDQIDCVLCHGKTYNGGGEAGSALLKQMTRELATGAWRRLKMQKQSAAKSRQACKRCHVNSGGKVFAPDGKMTKGFKYGTDYVAEPYQLTYDNGSGVQETATIDNDVHAKAGMRCAECHFIGEHKTQFGQHNVSWAHDKVPDTLDCSNANCHGTAPHKNSANYYKDTLDKHTAYLACQTCHITHTGGLMKRDLRYPIKTKATAISMNSKMRCNTAWRLSTAGSTEHPAAGKECLKDPAPSARWEA